MLFTGSIRENIERGKPGASLEEIQSAAEKAFAHNFITSFTVSVMGIRSVDPKEVYVFVDFAGARNVTVDPWSFACCKRKSLVTLRCTFLTNVGRAYPTVIKWTRWLAIVSTFSISCFHTLSRSFSSLFRACPCRNNVLA